jgi:L-malate glycosyltransferase
MDKIKVLFIIDVFDMLGGAEKNLFEVTAGLNKNRFEPIVLSLHSGEANSLLLKKGVRAVDLKINKIYSPSALVKAVKLIRFIRKENIKIVVTYHESSDFYGGIIGKLAGVPVMISSRRDMGYKLKKRHIYFYRYINRLFDRILTVSSAVKDIIFERERTPYHKIVTVYNGVEVARYSEGGGREQLRKRYNISKDSIVIGILASLREIKGHKHFIDAAAIVAGKFPNARFLVVGPPANPDYFFELKEQVRRLGLESKLVFTGEYNNTPEILSIIDISVLSSINEGFSNAILESMAAEKPIVATNAGGTPEALVNGESGFLVPPRDSAALAKYIMELAGDSALRERMGKAAKKRAEERFDLPVMIRNIENLYDTLLERHEKRAQYSFDSTYHRLRNQLFQLIKTAAGAALDYSGIYFFAQRPTLEPKILAYHRISEDNYDPLGMNITTSIFESHLRDIKANYRVLGLEEAVEGIRTGRRFTSDSVVLTFDDGYRNTFTTAFPLLEKYGITATIFLTAGAIDKADILWYDEVVTAFERTDKKVIDLRQYGLKEYIIPTLQKKYFASIHAAMKMKYMDKDTREEAMARLFELTGVDRDKPAEISRLLSWGEVSEMRKRGITIGSHGMSHSILSALSGKSAEYEIVESKKLIQRRIGIEVTMFSYPNGGKSEFNDDAADLVQKSGYLGACTLIAGENKGLSPFTLNRYCVTTNMLSSVTGKYSAGKFRAEILKEKLKHSLFPNVDWNNSNV